MYSSAESNNKEPLDFKLKFYKFKYKPRKLNFTWSKAVEWDLDSLKRLMDEIVESCKYIQKLYSIIIDAEIKEEKYQKNVEKFMQQVRK
jgi:hypothetical protein